ncbi:hypothetical protein CcaCcLH18_13824 [Colletotrichum camelliae]|nr:hypothetical protein CcaCcLH18_13824 [Colletotrichum camelliae]
MSDNSLNLVDLGHNSCIDAEQEDDFVLFDRPDTAMDWDIVDDQSDDGEEVWDCGSESHFGGCQSGGEIDAEPEMEKNNEYWSTCEHCGVASWRTGTHWCKNGEMKTDLDYFTIHSATKCDNTPLSATDANVHEYLELPRASEVAKSTDTRSSILSFVENSGWDNAQVFCADDNVTLTEQVAVKDKAPSTSRIPRMIKTTSPSSTADPSPETGGESKTCSSSRFARHRALRRALPLPSGGRPTYRRCEACH